MMGQHDRSEALFYYFRLEGQVPETHLLRLIEKHISFEFVRFQESKLFEELFEEIVRQCVEVGLVQGKHLSVDGSFVEANAAKDTEQLLRLLVPLLESQALYAAAVAF